MNNTPLIVSCVVSIAGCVGASYLANQISEAPAIHDRDILQTTSVEGVSVLSKDAAKPLLQKPSDPKEIFQLYLAKTITLEDALELLTRGGKDADIKSLYEDVSQRIQALPEDSDTRAYLESFKKAMDRYYPALTPKPAPVESPPAPEPVPEPESPPAPVESPPAPVESPPASEPVPEPEPTPAPEPVVETPSEPTAPNPLTESKQEDMSTPIAPPKIGGRRRNVTQKQRHSVIRTILYA